MVSSLVAGSRSLSEHAHPLRSVHPNRASGTVGQIKCNPARKWAAVINHHSNRLPVLRIRHRYSRSERQRAMRSRIPVRIECLTTRRPPPRGIEGRDYMLPRTSSVRFGVREEPSEAPTLSLRGRRDQPRQSQSKHAKKLTHRLIPLHPNTFPEGTDLIVAMAIARPTPIANHTWPSHPPVAGASVDCA